MKSSLNYVVVLDTETGNLFNSKIKAFYDAALIEVAVAVVDCRTLEVVEETSWIIKPYKDDLIYSAEAEAVHGISKQIIESKGMEEKKVFKEFKNLLIKYKNPRHKAAICGHNLNGFDLEFIKNWFEFHDESWEDIIKWTLDSMMFAYLETLEQTDYKLHTCCSEHSIDLVDAHRAGADTRATAQLFIEFVKRLRGVGLSVNNTAEKTIRYRETFQL
jgi:DNA polymerase III alpha subunit (gram-positive type)